jgi:hypothetical protein
MRENTAGALAVADDLAQERDVAADRLERARRIEQHEPVSEHDVEPLEGRDRIEVLLDRHLLEQHVEAALDAGFDPHVDEEEPGLPHAREQLGLDIFGAAADLSDRRLRVSTQVPWQDLGDAGGLIFFCHRRKPRA